MKMKHAFTLLAGLFVLAGVGIAANHGGGLTAGHPLYSAELAAEEGVEGLAPNSSAKIQEKVRQAGERANETDELAEENETELANETANAYAEEMKEVNDLGKEISDLAQKQKIDELVATATMHHTEVLSKVYERVPEQAKAGIQKALNNSVTGHQKAVDAMKRRGQPTDQFGNVTSRVPDSVRGNIGMGAGKPDDVGPGMDGGPDTGGNDSMADNGGSDAGPDNNPGTGNSPY